MSRFSRSLSSLGASLGLAASLFFAAAQAAAAPSFTTTSAVHDPAVIKEGDYWYVFGSHNASARSADLMNWEQLTTQVMIGNPINPNPFVDYATVLNWAQTTTFWAPDVYKFPDGKFYHYYCACKGDSPRSGLGLAKSDSVMGAQVNQQVMLYSGMWGLTSPDGTIYDATKHPNVVDPSIFRDKDGKLWMVYGSYSGGIFILELDASTGLIKDGQGYGTRLIGNNHSTIEGPCIFYCPETDYYYFFVTYGGLGAADGYNIRMSRSRNPQGPYYDAKGTDMRTVMGKSGTLFDNDSIAPHGIKLMGNWMFLHNAAEPSGTAVGYVSPGGVSFYHDAKLGRYVMVYHQRFIGRGEQHEVHTRQLFLTEEDWFVAAPHRYAKEAIATTDTSALPGQWKIVNHLKDIQDTASATAHVSTIVTLNGDGTITGTSSGTWALSGDHYARITLGGVDYKGVWAQNWDNDSKAWVRTFSVMSADGTCVWGTKFAATSALTEPSVSSNPVDQSVAAGSGISFSVVASGNPLPSYQWRLNGQNIAGATSATLNLTHVSSADAGYYACVVSNSVAATYSAPALLTVTEPEPFAIATQPASQTVSAGANVILTVAATGPSLSYQWKHYNSNGVATEVSGATSASLSLSSVTTEEAGDYVCVVTSGSSSLTTSRATLTVNPLMTANASARLINISARAHVKSGAEKTIVGFVVAGSGSEKLLVRASGMTLEPFGISNYVADPSMELFNTADVSAPIDANDDWGTGATSVADLRAAFNETYAFNWADGTNECALLPTLTKGNFTAEVRGKTSSGIGLVELYERSGSTARLVNISARASMSSGQETLTAGFSIGGTGLKTVLIRLSGPALQSFLGGWCEDPILKLFNQNDTSTPIVINDDWDSDTTVGNQINTVANSVYAFSWTRGSKDAALLVTLRPGLYTAEGIAKGDAGISLIEVYEVNY